MIITSRGQNFPDLKQRREAQIHPSTNILHSSSVDPLESFGNPGPEIVAQGSKSVAAGGIFAASAYEVDLAKVLVLEPCSGLS